MIDELRNAEEGLSTTENTSNPNPNSISREGSSSLYRNLSRSIGRFFNHQQREETTGRRSRAQPVNVQKNIELSLIKLPLHLHRDSLVFKKRRGINGPMLQILLDTSEGTGDITLEFTDGGKMLAKGAPIWDKLRQEINLKNYFGSKEKVSSLGLQTLLVF